MNDAAATKILHEVLAHEPLDNNFGLVDFKRDGNSLKVVLTDIKGETVKNLYDLAGETYQQDIQSEYQSKASQLVAKLIAWGRKNRDQGNIVNFGFEWKSESQGLGLLQGVVIYPGNKKVYISISARNVVIDESGNSYIIDPH